MTSFLLLGVRRMRSYSCEELLQGMDFTDRLRGVKKLRGFVLRESTLADRREDVGFAFIRGEEHVFLKKNAIKLGFIIDPRSRCGAYKKEEDNE